MARKASSSDVVFIAEYEDGSKEQFVVDAFTISPKRSGVAIARTIARECRRAEG